VFCFIIKLLPGSADYLTQAFYPLFLHELLDSLKDIKRSPRIAESGRAYLHGAGPRHDELDVIPWRSVTVSLRAYWRF